MPKESSERPQKQLTRKQISRREKEQRLRQQLIAGTAIVLGLVVLIMAWGLYDQYVARPRQPVATVAGTPIRLDMYQKMVRYWRWRLRSDLDYLETQKQRLSTGTQGQDFLLQYVGQQIQNVQQQLMTVDMATLDNLIDDHLVRQECARRGISVSSDEVQLKLEEQFGYNRNPPTPEPVTATLPITVTPTPTTAPMTKEQFEQQYGTWAKEVRGTTGLSEQEFRHWLESTLYRGKLEQALGAEVPAVAEQVHARHILLQTREEAEAVLARLNTGEDFAKLAAELSQDTSNQEQGGDLGWIARGDMVPEFDAAVFALQAGQTSQIVETQFGFHIIRVEERDANRPLEGSALKRAQDRAVNDWFEGQRIRPDIVRNWNSSMVPQDLPTRTARRR